MGSQQTVFKISYTNGGGQFVVAAPSRPGRIEADRSMTLPRRWHRAAVVLLSISSTVFPLHAEAAPTHCAGFFRGGMAPDILNPAAQSRIHTLCFRFYSVDESGITKTALWSAERLTRASVAAAHAETRVDAFHAEEAISGNDRAEIADYRRSGYDRGHMSPSGDMPDAAAQAESFSLANMVPQAPDNNRHLWQGIEITTRAMAKYDGELYVVTGPAFIGRRPDLDERVEVPSHIWKAIYDPKRGAAAYITANRPGNDYAVVSIASLTRMTGVDPFPGLSEQIKSTAMALPPPRPSGRRLKTGPVSLAALGLDGKSTLLADTGRAEAAGGASGLKSVMAALAAADTSDNRARLRDALDKLLALLQQTWRIIDAVLQAHSPKSST